jgi:hypothetical protein
MKRHKHAKLLETIVHHIQLYKDTIHLYKDLKVTSLYMSQGHLSGSLGKTCNHTTCLKKRGSVFDNKRKRWKKKGSSGRRKGESLGVGPKKSPKCDKKRFGLSTKSPEGSRASAP